MLCLTGVPGVKPRRDTEKSKTKSITTTYHFNTSTNNDGDKSQHSLRGLAHANNRLETAEKLRMCLNQSALSLPV